ncbi:TetR/AcrR family transcriptional regulator [Actinomadura madurae]|uniref:TetR/AcrR family transcriptional regulator n=1 Tax=Actinomadura madurae TaxID=1993 RepID=UPI0020274155|nr:TetR/AcrR family transcriptional regulator [Actinomadura madurae]MCP9955419.1 TetR/AcrR family transcriptional regulator [Actinomadura madurae]MCP9972151.1 TetR/AcrR family transcriptional regulator [Actinomadura madurae]MCP9984656.1 TetR/AcrR family transcriptional regulator [Actinomadura madurae]MCQ0003793.1 TetR/AcrR family transcriptional regulator [Actinomadura madurae]MCQ0020848.1 TetR/AcrR family transcriptional regulator [Actinomadura madurae]
MGLRETKRERTRRAIQEQAMRLFRENGFDTTTVAEVAEAADVSAMTVFRHFPTKEHLVMEDDYDPLIAERVRRRPAGEPLLRRIATSILEGLDELPPDPHLLLTRTRLILDTPALRARVWENNHTTQQAIAAALPDEDPFEVQVAASACLAAATTAMTRWTEAGGRPDLRTVMAEALEVIVR